MIRSFRLLTWILFLTFPLFLQAQERSEVVSSGPDNSATSAANRQSSEKAKCESVTISIIKQIVSSGGSGKCTGEVLINLMAKEIARGLVPVNFRKRHMDAGKTTAYEIEMEDSKGNRTRKYPDSPLIHCEDLHG